MQICSWIKKEYLNSLFKLLWTLLCDYSPTPIGSFLKVSCYMKSETESVNFSCSVTSKSIGLTCTLNFSPTHDSVAPCLGHLKIPVHWVNADHSVVDTFPYMVSKKSCFVNISHSSISSKNIKPQGVAKLMLVNMNFRKY